MDKDRDYNVQQPNNGEPIGMDSNVTEEMEALFAELRAENEKKAAEVTDFDVVVRSDGSISGFMDKEDPVDEEAPHVLAAAEAKYAAEPVNAEEELESAVAAVADEVISEDNSNGKKAQQRMKPQKEKKAKKRISFWQFLARTVIVIGCLGIIAGCILGVAVALYLADATASDNKLLDINQIKLSFATRLMAFDDEKQEWYEYERLYSDENRLWVEYSELPEDLIKAIVASEDQRFWTHHGVDWKRTVFAFLNEYVHRMSESTQGGSTLTQQLIKNITDEKSVSGLDGVKRKLREIYRALEMEKNYSKEQILEAYLNTFRLGGQVAGIEAAANYYFGKSASDLTMAESAAIVCITKYPTAYDPYLYPDENHRQRNFVLYNMYDYGMVTEAEYKAAKAESDAMVFDEANKETSSTSQVYTYFTDAVIEQVLEDLQNIKGMTFSEAYNELFQGGLTIYLTVDPFVQKTVEEVAADPEIWPELELDENGEPLQNQIEGAIVVMDYNGEVKGVAGGIRGKSVSRGLNRATTSKRQTGSAMKPLAAYAPGIELKKINYSTLLPDTPSEEYEGKPWPRNFSRSYSEYPLTVYRGLATSLNTIAVHVINLVGVDFSFDFLTTSLGFTSLVDSRWDESQGKRLTDRTKSLALGGLTDGCTVLEMTAAYAIFGNSGIYTTPHFYTQISDKSGDVLLDKTKYITKSAAISQETAEIMNYLLRGVIREGTGTRAAFGNMPLCGKSGTSSDNNDFWFIGLNPYYVCGAWMGYDENGEMSPYSIHFDVQYAFRDVMSTICEDLPEIDFPTTGNLVRAAFCMATGDLATGACPDTRVGYYTRDNMPDYCDHASFGAAAPAPEG